MYVYSVKTFLKDLAANLHKTMRFDVTTDIMLHNTEQVY